MVDPAEVRELVRCFITLPKPEAARAEMVYTEDYAMGVVCGQTRTAAILVNAVDASDSCCAVLTRETKPCLDSDHTSSS